MTLGFTESMGHSFKPVLAIDNNAHCINTYQQNFGNHGIAGDIVEFLEDRSFDIPQADVVIGGPPCQGFSLLNKQRDNDPRRHLWIPYLQIVDLSGASVFVMENVPQLLGTEEHELILETADEMGFKTVSAKLCAADYGVPQTRHRAFIIGCRKIDPSPFFPPLKTHRPQIEKRNGNGKSKNPYLFNVEYISDESDWLTLREAIGDLPKPKGVEIREDESPLDLHFGRSPTQLSIDRYKTIPNEGENRFDLQERRPDITPDCWIKKKSGGTDLFGRLWWDRPAFTIRTEFYKPEKGRYLHPQQHRPITHREAARIQSFPDSFKFLGSKIEIAKQIGNAVPPALAARIADIVYILVAQSRG